MLFNSVSFLVFFPIVVLIYFFIPHRVRWAWLLISSYYFYMSWNPKYALLLLLSTFITYLSGLLIHKANRIPAEKKRHRLKVTWVVLSFLINLAILFFFKYYNFMAASINYIATTFGIQIVIPDFDVLLPVGISFYTFQALSYTVDVYRGEISAERHFGKYALFVSFFPQLVAGPIERSKNLLSQMHEKHYFNYDRVKNGLILMLWGFFMKLVIADRVAILVNEVYNNYNEYKGFVFVLATILFAVQIYCDFAGYSNIAIGAAQVMGFRLMTNFDTPYFSVSIREFWRRWHISLSTWFRDYLYIPLGGSRCSKTRRYLNLMITFLVSGLWHGANWTFVIWGGLHGLYQVIGDILHPLKNRINTILHVKTDRFSYRFLQICFTFCLVDFAWLFFRANSLNAAFTIIQRTISHLNPGIFFDGTLFTLGLNQNEFFIMLAAITVLLVVSILKQRMDIRKELANQQVWFRWLIYYLMILAIYIFGIYGPMYDASQFIYFQF